MQLFAYSPSLPTPHSLNEQMTIAKTFDFFTIVNRKCDILRKYKNKIVCENTWVIHFVVTQMYFMI